MQAKAAPLDTGARVLTWKSFSRIVLIQAAAILALVATLGIAVNVVFKDRYLRETEKQAEEFLDVLAKDLPAKPTDHWCMDYASGTPFRITVLSAGYGTVLCDSTHNSRRDWSSREAPRTRRNQAAAASPWHLASPLRRWCR